jgi:DNA-binding CsgD family transcriptional regulator/PAS domain-containing protein
MLLSPAKDPDLIAGFYEAAAHGDQWSGAWSALCAAFEAETGLLYRQSRPNAAPRILATRNWPSAPATPGGHFVHSDPLWQIGARGVPGADIQIPAGTVLAGFNPSTQPPATAFHVLCATIPLGGTAQLGMGLHRTIDAPRFTEADREALDGVGRHVAAAVRLESLLAAERSASIIRGSVLDLLPHGVVVATGQGTLIFANRAARRFAEAGGLELGRGRAGIANLRHDESARLEALITSVAGGGPGGCTRVTRNGGLPVLAALVDPMPAGLAEQAGLNSFAYGRPDRPLVLITLRDITVTADSGAAHLMDLFGLTAAEAGIVPQLLAGDSVSLIAQSRGVAVGTVKTQAAKVLAKTGAPNLRALATMIAALGCA